jgi:hypothetical protein
MSNLNHIIFRNKRLTLLILFLIFNFNLALGKPSKLDTVHVIKKITVTSVPQNELDAYKLLYQTSQNSYESQKDNIYWILGLLVTFIVLIFSSQYIFNWRLNKEEIARIKSDLEAKFQTELLISKEEHLLRIKEIIDEINTKHTEQLSLYKALIKDNKEKYIEYKSDIKENITLNNEIIKNDLQEIKKNIDSKIKTITIDVENVTGYVWSLRGVEMNALRRFIGVLEISIDGKSNLTYKLKDIEQSLTKVKDLENSLYGRLKDIIEEIRSKHPDQYHKELQKIEELYETKPLFEYNFNGDGSFKYVDKKVIDQKK